MKLQLWAAKPRSWSCQERKKSWQDHDRGFAAHNCSFTTKKKTSGTQGSPASHMNTSIFLQRKERRGEISESELDCEQSLFSSKIRGKERKTSKRASVTVSVTWDYYHRRSQVTLTVTLARLPVFRSFPRIFEEKRDYSQSKSEPARLTGVIWRGPENQAMSGGPRAWPRAWRDKCHVETISKELWDYSDVDDVTLTEVGRPCCRLDVHCDSMYFDSSFHRIMDFIRLGNSWPRFGQCRCCLTRMKSV